jgi:DNA invertase Pin-like site-specific DNA recombinase
MLSGLAELEKEQLLERQRIGINRAKAEGKYKGRKRVDNEVLKAVGALREQGYSVLKLVRRLGLAKLLTIEA